VTPKWHCIRDRHPFRFWGQFVSIPKIIQTIVHTWYKWRSLAPFTQWRLLPNHFGVGKKGALFDSNKQQQQLEVTKFVDRIHPENLVSATNLVSQKIIGQARLCCITCLQFTTCMEIRYRLLCNLKPWQTVLHCFSLLSYQLSGQHRSNAADGNNQQRLVPSSWQRSNFPLNFTLSENFLPKNRIWAKIHYLGRI